MTGAAIEHRRQLRELCERGIGAQVVVACEPREGNHQILVETPVERGHTLGVTRQCQFVLGLPTDVPTPHHLFAVFAHRQAGAPLVHIGNGRKQHRRPQLRQESQARGRALGTVEAKNQPAQPLADGNGSVRSRVDTACNAGLDLAHGDLVAYQNRGLQRGGAGLLHIVCRRLRRQAARQSGVSSQIEIPRMFEHGAGRDFTESFTLQPKAPHDPRQYGSQHVEIAAADILGVLTGERDAHAAENADTFRGFHVQLLCRSPQPIHGS